MLLEGEDSGQHDCTGSLGESGGRVIGQNVGETCTNCREGRGNSRGHDEVKGENDGHDKKKNTGNGGLYKND